MAESERKNVDALNENNLIDAKNMTSQKMNRIENNKSGDTTINELQDEYDMTEVLRKAGSNTLYNNMEEPCRMLGIDLDQLIIEYFTKEVVTMTDLAESIQKAMISIKNDINKHDPYLVFDNSGTIDPNGVNEKAKGKAIPESLEKYIDDFTTVRNVVDTSEKSSEFTKEFWKELGEHYSPSLRRFVEEYGNTLSSWVDNSYKDRNGKNYSYNKNSSIDENIAKSVAINVVTELSLFADTTKSRTMQERNKSAEKLIAYYAYIMDALDGKKVSQETEEILAKLNECIGEDLYNQLGIRIDSRESLEKFARSVGKEVDDLLDYKKNADYQEISKTIQQIDDGKITLEDISKDREKHDFIKLMGLIQESGVSTSDIYSPNDILANRGRAHVERAKRFVEEKYPEYYEEAIDNKNIDEYSTFRFRALRELKAREILTKGIERRENEGLKIGEAADGEYDIMKMAAAVLRLDDTDEKTKKLALDYIESIVPNLELTDELRKKIIAGKNMNSLNPFFDKVQQEGMYIVEHGKNERGIETGQDFTYDGLIILEEKTKEGLYERAENIGKNDGRNILGLTEEENAEYEALYESKIATYNEQLYNVKYLEYVYSSIRKNAKVLDEKKGTLDQADEVRFVKELVLAAKMADKMGENRIKTSISEYLVDFLPNAFYSDGEINLETIDEKFNEYLVENGYHEDVEVINEYLEQEIEVAVQDEINKTKIETNMGQRLVKAKDDLRESFRNEKNLQDIEDTIRFFNFIKRNTGSISEESKTELDELVAKSRKNLDGIHNAILTHLPKDNPNLITEHRGFDEELEKDKFYYLASQARRIVASDRLSETKNRVDKGKIFNENDRMGVIGSYLAILNDYKDAELDAVEYKKIIDVATELLQKMNPDLVSEDGVIDNDKVLDEYNKLFKKDPPIQDFDKVLEIEEQESLMRYGRRLAKELTTPKEQRKTSKYSALITNENLYVNAKINDALKKDVVLREKETKKLIGEFWKEISGEKEVKTDKEKVELISDLALVYGMFQKSAGKTSDRLSYEARKLTELERKTFTIAENRLMEMFPEALDGDTKIYGALEKQIIEYLCEHRPEIKERIEKGENIYQALQEERQDKNKKKRKAGKGEKEPTVDELLEQADNVLKGSKVEKTDNDKAKSFMLIKMITDGMENADNLQIVSQKLLRNYSEEEKVKFGMVANNQISPAEMSYMKRVAGLARIEMFENREDSFKMIPKKKGDALLDVYGTILVCESLPKDSISEDIVARAKKIIKDLAPGVINAKGEINASKLTSKVNAYRRIGNLYKKLNVEDLDKYSMDKLALKVTTDYAAKDIDSRYNDSIYMPSFVNRVQTTEKIKEEFEKSIGVANMSLENILHQNLRRYTGFNVTSAYLKKAKHFRVMGIEKAIPEVDIGMAFEKMGVIIGEPEKTEQEAPVVTESSKIQEEPEVTTVAPASKTVSEPEGKTVQETYEEKVVQTTESVMKAEEVIIGEEYVPEEKADNLPAVIEKKNVFKNIFEKVSKAVKGIVEKVTGNASSSNNASSSTTSNAGNDKKVEVAKTNELVQRAELNVGLAQKAAAESQLNAKEEIDEGR